MVYPFQVYTECSSTHDIDNKGHFMMWYPMSLDSFLQKFGNENVLS